MERKEVPRLFFNEEEQKQIVQAIEESERKTSAEIVVRLEKTCPGNPIERCRELLQTLGLTSTKGRTGVIILITVQDHNAAIFGDEAIDKVIGQDGWNDICDQLVNGFKKGEPCLALCYAIQTLGDRLTTCFPCTVGDVNELANEPSYSDEQ